MFDGSGRLPVGKGVTMLLSCFIGNTTTVKHFNLKLCDCYGNKSVGVTVGSVFAV